MYAQVWEPFEALLVQVEQRVASYKPRGDDHLLLPEVLMGPLALRLSRAAAAYDGHDQQFVRDAYTVFQRVTKRDEAGCYFDYRYEHAPAYTAEADEGRRLPRPYETIVETMRRLRDANTIKKQVSGTASAAILGGSASYGRFYNVRGGDGSAPFSRTPSTGDNSVAGETVARQRSLQKTRKPSDLDFLVIVPKTTDVRLFIDHLRRVPQLASDELQFALERVSVFEKIATDTRALFSHKFSIWADPEHVSDPMLRNISGASQQYSVSFHIISRETARFLLLSGSPIEDDRKEFIFDYRVDPPSLGLARGFDGFHQEFSHKYDHVDGGKLVKLRVFDTVDGRFKPGLHQQLILPQFELRWDNLADPLHFPLLEFKFKILERLRMEQNRFPLRQQHLSLAHVRYHVFSPHVKRRVDDFEHEY